MKMKLNEKNVINWKIILAEVSEHCASFGTKKLNLATFGNAWCSAPNQGHVPLTGIWTLLVFIYTNVYYYYNGLILPLIYKCISRMKTTIVNKEKRPIKQFAKYRKPEFAFYSSATETLGTISVVLSKGFQGCLNDAERRYTLGLL